MSGADDVVKLALKLVMGAGEKAAPKAKLPMDLDNRMYRASEMGFDPTRRYYHLTRKDFDAFKLGADPSSHTGGGAIWLRDDPRNNISAHQVPSFEAEGARDIPLFIRPTKELPTMEWSLLRQQGKLNDQFPLMVTPEENKMLRDMGYSHASMGGETVVFDPKDLRSPHAVFDPDEIESADYMKASGGRIAKGPGGWVDDVVKMAGKVISGEGEDAAKAGIKTYRGTPQPTENLIDLFHGTTPEAFDAITSSGDIFGSSRFSPRRDVAETFAHNVGGDANTVVKVKAPASSLMIDLDLPAAKLLTPDEAAAYLDKPDWTILDFIENGYSVGVPDTSVLSIDRAAGGRIAKGPGGWVDDVVKMAGKAVMGEGDNVTRLSDVRSARETDALIKKIKSAVNLVKSGHFQAGRQALINQKSLDLHKSGMLPLQQGTIVTPPSTWDMPGDWRVSGYWYDEKDPRRFGYKLQNESGQTYDAAASDPRAGLRHDKPYSFGAGFKAYAGPNADPPKPVAPPVEKPATPKPPEVLDAINKEYEDLFGSEDPFKPRAHGGRIAKGPGGWLDDVVKMAGKVISGEGEDAAESALRAFAETKLKTPKGKPMRLYHLTPGNFSEFSVSPENRSGPVVFLSPYADFQPAYHQAAERGPNDEITSIFKEGANVMPVYADVRNPLILDSYEKIKEAQAKYQSGDRGFPYFVKPEAKAAMEADGYDGIIFGGNDPAPYRSETSTEGWNPHIGFQRNREEEIIVFDPKKVKSAISNTGKYDFTDPDITKAGGGSTSKPQRSMGGNNSISGALNVARGLNGGE